MDRSTYDFRSFHPTTIPKHFFFFTAGEIGVRRAVLWIYLEIMRNILLFILINLSQAITRNTTLLVDDDANNIRIAFENKVRAVRFDPKNIQV